ncbi:hypothetical protein RJT34_23798 [Clitoria ternatea]|uniref:CCHC-type domain-containing protein n=1 Tax=Clitoria ternatea TaxID=43366 RepID=A0AAN9FLN9_CLITE
MNVDNAGAGGGRGQVPPKPPDIRVSFKEKVLGRATGDPQPVENLIKRGVMTLDNDNRLLPRFTMEEDDYQRLCQPWKDCLVVKLLGKTLGFALMKGKLQQTWKLNGGFDLIDVGHGFFLVKFDVAEEKERVIMEGPWLIFDHYLSVMHWHPDFVASQAKIDKTLVWIRFPGLGLEFYNESVLLTLASAVGTPYKVDMRTLQMERGRFARVCVEVDLDKPVVGKFCLRNIWYKIEYEGLHLLCSSCGRYGHLLRQCPDVRQENHALAKSPDVAQPENAEANPELTNNLVPESTHGEWIVVKRNNKKPNTIALSKENESWKPGTTSMSGAFQHFSNGPSRDHMKTTIPSTRYKRPRHPTPSRESRERTHGSSPHAGDLDLHQDNLNSQPTFPLSTRINMQGTTMDDLDQHQGEFNIYPPTNSPIMHMKPRGPATATRAHTSSCPGIHARDYGMEQHGLRKMEDNSSTSLHHNEETMFSFGANHPQCPSNSDQGTSSADKEQMFVFTQKPPDGVSC